MKKRMDFGHGTSNEFVWFYSSRQHSKGQSPHISETLKNADIRVVKEVFKWDRSFLLDRKGKVYQWDVKNEVSQEEEKKQKEYLKELTTEVDGKSLSSHKVKDIAHTSSCLFLTTENGEVIVGKVNSGKEEPYSEYSPSKGDQDNLFAKRLSKITFQEKVGFTFSKLNSIQSNFISHVTCGTSHALLLTQSGFLYSFGKNEYGQLGHSAVQGDEVKEPSIIYQLLNLKVFSISAGKHHNIIIGTARDTLTQTFQVYQSENALYTTIDKSKTLVYGWGNNKHGQLGMDDDKDRNVPVLIEKILHMNFKKVSCGHYHSALLEDSGSMCLFGNNEFGQIGVGSEEQKIRAPALIFPIPDNDEEYQVPMDSQQVKFIVDVVSFAYSTVAISDDNEIYTWGKNIFFPQKQSPQKKGNQEADIIREPMLVWKDCQDESILQLFQDDIQVMERIFPVPGIGLLFTSKTKFPEDNQREGAPQFYSDPNPFGPMSNQMNNSSTQMSKRSSFLKNEPPNSNPSMNQFNPFQNMNNGISFTKEFENLLQYIAITAGTTKMPQGVQPMSFRPANLPPKTQEEEKLHQKLVEENRKQYLVKIKEKEKQIEKKRQEQETKEKKMHEMKNIWEKEIIPNWDSLKRTKRVRELWIEGLPPVIRGKVWFYAFGNRSALTKDLYVIMAEKGQKVRKILKELNSIDQEIVDQGGQSRLMSSLNPGKENQQKQNIVELKLEDQQNKQSISNQQAIITDLNKKYDKLKKKLGLLISVDGGLGGNQVVSREKSISIIETDIPRTFPMLGFFKVGGVYYDHLQRMLEAFTMYRPDIGYVQGMSYVAATLLLYMDEHSAFVTFCNMLTKYPILPFYTFSDVQVRKILQLFKQVFAHNLPQLCEHLEMENVQPKQYAYEWFMTIFTRALNLSLVSRVWDFYFLDGIFVMFQTSIAILRTLEKQLLEVDFEGIMGILKNVSDHVTEEEQLVSYIYDVSFPKWIYDEIPKLESEFLKQI